MIFEIGAGLLFLTAYLMNLWGCIFMIEETRKAIKSNDKLSAFGSVCLLLFILSLSFLLTGALQGAYL
jgi:uncharacterized membrane protein YiaA